MRSDSGGTVRVDVDDVAAVLGGLAEQVREGQVIAGAAGEGPRRRPVGLVEDVFVDVVLIDVFRPRVPRGAGERRTLFYKYSPHAVSWSARYYDAAHYDDLTEAELAILEAPNARYQGRMAKIDSQFPPPPRATVKDFVDHIDYAVKLIGIDHIGISSDFDGGGGVEGWSDASQTFNVTLELVRRGYTEEQIAKMWSGNLIRVMRQVERVAADLQKKSD